MEYLPVLVLCGCLAGLFVLAVRESVTRRRGLFRGWSQAAQDLGFNLTRSDTYLGHRITGRDGRAEIDVHALRLGGKPPVRFTRFAVREVGIPAGLKINPEGVLGGLNAAFGFGHDLRTGNVSFDDRTRVAGPEAQALALLDHATRARLSGRLAHATVRVEDSTVVFEIPELITEAARVVGVVKELVDLARCLSLTGRSVPAMLRTNAASEPLRAVRQRNLEVLIRDYPGEKDTTLACERAVADERDAQIVLMAAKRLGEPGWPYVQKVMEMPRAEASLRVEALEHLSAQVPSARLLPLLKAALGSSCPALHPPAILALGRLPDVPACALILLRLENAHDATAVAAARVLGDLRDGRAEWALVQLLARENPHVRIAAATALGKLGTRAAVEPLLACSRTSSVLGDGEVRRAVREALVIIRARLGDVDVGRLSVVETGGEVGALSVAPDEGALSLADEPLPARQAAPAPETDLAALSADARRAAERGAQGGQPAE